MKILLAQLNPTIGDFHGNVKKILNALDSARKQGVDIVAFSETVICGYMPEDLLLHADFVEKIENSLQQIIPATKGLMAVVGTVRRNSGSYEKKLFNSAAVIADGKLLGYYDKSLLPTYDVFDERRYFEPGSDFPVWNWKGKKIGVLICEDMWQHAGLIQETHYACDPVEKIKMHRPDLVINLSASPYHFQKPETRAMVCRKTAQAVHCPVAMCCQVGGNDQLVFDGYSMVTDEGGDLRSVAQGFAEDLHVVDLSNMPPKIDLKYDAEKDLYSALVLGLRDYFHKQGFKKGCLGISGGIDSALVACIAVDALGKDNVLGLSMPSRYSSEGSKIDAVKLADNLGIEMKTIPIELAFASFLDVLDPFFKDKKPDVTEENLQARIRGSLLMAFSNKFGYIVMSTGNKSEMGMGFMTLYGDMCGGIGVISDLTKHNVYRLSRWINREREIIPWDIIDKVPSAELRPNQKDTDSLPEYNIVDAVLTGYVEDFLTPEEISDKHNIPLNIVQGLVHKIHLAEYKRRQAPPGIRVTKKSFRVGRRYPIVQKWH